MTSDPLQVEPRATPAAPRGGILSLAPHQRALRARIVIGVLAAGVAWASLPFLAGLLGAVVLAVLLAPLHRRMAPRIGPRVGWVQRISASVPVIVPVAMSTIGWYATCISPRSSATLRSALSSILATVES